MTQRVRTPELRKLTLTASLAAAYTIFRAIPISRLIGTTGSITAAGMIAPMIGILLEPAYGVAAVFTGTLIASLLPWNGLSFYGLGFLPGTLNVLLVGLVARGRRTEATLMFLIVLGLFIINPYTMTFVGIPSVSPPLPYYWLHLVALVVLTTPLAGKISAKLVSVNYRSLSLAVLALAFTGTMIEHLTGGILYASVLAASATRPAALLPPICPTGSTFWCVAFVAYPIERAILVLGALLICTPLVRILKSTIKEKLSSETQLLVPTHIPSLVDSESKN